MHTHCFNLYVSGLTGSVLCDYDELDTCVGSIAIAAMTTHVAMTMIYMNRGYILYCSDG